MGHTSVAKARGLSPRTGGQTVEYIYYEYAWHGLQFYALFNSVLVISGRKEVDNKRLCAMELRLRLRRFHLERGSNSVC